MAQEPEDEDDPRIRQRLEEVLSLILCPVAGCWGLHGAETDYFYDENIECFVLEVWPVGIARPVPHEGNGDTEDEEEILYELAQFDFLRLAKEVPLQHFHFNQQRAVFEIGWPEFGHDLQLCVHIVPAELDEPFPP